MTSGSALFFGSSREVSRLAERHVLRADGVAGGVLGRLADVDQHALLAVDELHRIGRRHPAGRRPPACSIGQSSRPPEAIAAAKRYQFSKNEIQGRGEADALAGEQNANYRIPPLRAAARRHRLARAGLRPSETPPMHKLVLIRHGESTWNLENRFTGWTDVDLTADRASSRRAPPAGC